MYVLRSQLIKPRRQCMTKPDEFNAEKLKRYLQQYATAHERGQFNFPNPRPTQNRTKHYCCFSSQFACCEPRTVVGVFLIFKNRLLGICPRAQQLVKNINITEFNGANQRLRYYKSFRTANQIRTQSNPT